MHLAWIVVALVSFLGAGASATAQETRPDTRPADASRLIEQLDSDEFATREQATRDLVALGSDARPALLAARTEGSLERRARIDQVLLSLDVRASSRPARKDASRVTLEVEGKRLSEVCAQLSAATGNSVRPRAGGDPTVTLSVRDVPWFEAIDRLCVASSRKLGWDPRERGLVLDSGAEKAEPVAYSGPLRISLVMLMLNRQIRFAGGTSTGNGNLQMRVDAEERSQALGVMMPIRVKELVDDQKRSLRYGDGQQQQQQIVQSQYVQRCDQRRQLQCFVPIAVPEPDAKSISRLELTLAVILPTELFEADLTNPEKGAEAGDGPFRVTVSEWKEAGAQREVKIAITRPLVASGVVPGPPIQDDVVAFYGSDGQVVVPTASGTAGDGDVLYTATFPLAQKIARIHVSSLKQIEVAEFPVVFENVPLP